MSAESVPIKPANELAAEITGETQVTDSNDPKDQKEYEFEFSYKDAKNKTWSGKFKNRILTINDKQRVQVLKAQLSGNLPMTALDNRMWYLNSWIAHMTISLIERPKWAKELTELYDENLITELFEEVASHEAQFCGQPPYYYVGAESEED